MTGAESNRLAEQADEAFDRAQRALEAGDYAAFHRAREDHQRIAAQHRRLYTGATVH